MGYRMRWVGVGLLVLSSSIVAGCSLFNSPPVANFAWSPLEPLARTEVRFEDSSTDQGGLFGGGGIASWNWDFGDNDSSTSEDPRHEYSKSGTYPVRLTVTDDGGQSHTAQKTVQILPSLHGTWRGFISDPDGDSVALELVFNHSTSGGIQGSAYMLTRTLSCDAISFNPTTKQIRFNLPVLGIRLDGTLDASETRIEGDWFELDSAVLWWSWDVSLQG
jgi:hypothetical protein